MAGAPSLVARLRHGVAWLLAGPQAERLNKSRNRLKLAFAGFCGLYMVIGGTMIHYALNPDPNRRQQARAQDAVSAARPDVIDRNGEVLATDVRTSSLYAEPRRLAASFDVDEATELLTAVLPDLNPREVRQRLASGKGFVWLRREITPEKQAEIHRLGIPGIGFLRENKRFYPAGPTLSHVLGHVNVDNQGIAGIERWIDGRGLAELHRAGLATSRNQMPIQLSVDLRVQHVLRDELSKAHQRFRTNFAAGVIMDTDTGEIVAMASIPDYDPNQPSTSAGDAGVNRTTVGVYEMGSVMKSLTVAMAIDSGRFNLGSMVDARFPLQVGRHSIRDFHAQRRVMSMAEVFTFSSNIGTSRMALTLGAQHQRDFLRKLGQLARVSTELGETARPILPPTAWPNITTATVSFGHGLSIAPLQALMGTAALVNGGYLVNPTLIKRTIEEARAVSPRVIRAETSQAMRYLMRLNSERGSGRRAEVDGFYVGGKTGTSEKVIGGRYSKTRSLTSFTAIFPADQPRYAMLVMLDEPKGLPETFGHSTAGWNAAPTTGAIIARAAPLLGLQPRFDVPPSQAAIMANWRGPIR